MSTDPEEAAVRLGAVEGGLMQAVVHSMLDDPPGLDRAVKLPSVELAWALKEACYAAWNSDPPRAVRAAEALGRIQTQGLAPEQAFEVRGLAAWTAGLASVAHGKMAQAVSAFDDAQALLIQAGRPDPAAQTQVPKIMALSMLGRIDEATLCAQAAQDRLLALGNLAAASRVGLNLGSLLLRREAYLEASQQYRKAAVLFARQGDLQHSVLADIGLAGALSSLGDFDEALRIYARVRMRAAHQSLEYPLAVADEYVALMQLARGSYGPALASMESARRRYEALGLPHALAIAEKQLADAYLELRLLPEALALFEAAVAKLASLNLPDEHAAALAQRGRTQALLGRVVAARESFAAAAALFAAAEHPVGLASVTLALAELALTQGLPEAALLQAQDAAASFAQARHADGQSRAEVIRAQALLQQGHLDDARQVFDSTLLSARKRQQLQVQVRSLTGQALVAQAAGLQTVARSALDQAIEMLEDQRCALPGEELRSAFLAEHLRPYQERLRLALQEGEPAQVLAHLERYRARALADQLDNAQRPLLKSQDTGHEDSALRERLNWLYRRVHRLSDEDEPSPLLQAELLRTESELLERARRRRLALDGATSKGVVGERTADFSLPALQAALSYGDALVEYGLLDDELFALVITPGRVALQRRVAHWPDVLRAVQSTRLQIETLRHGRVPVKSHLATITRRTWSRLQQVHDLVWAPLQAQLVDCSRVLVVPQAQLATVPFAAMLEAGKQHDRAPLKTGQSALVCALVPSARSALRGLMRQPHAPRSALALGASRQLPHSAREAGLVASLFEQGGLALVGEQATIAGLQTHAATVDVLHLACHAQFRSDNPRFSALHLNDGALTVELAETLRLRPCTVVLSACESGLADGGSGDEMVGLVRAFFVAGASRVLASLWPVEDEVTADFMACFYRALVVGHAPSTALQRAQAQIRARHPEPYFWAAFALFGGW